MRTPILAVAFGLLLIGPSVVACSSASRDVGGAPANQSGGGAEPTFADSGSPKVETYTPDEIWADDPPPQWCGPKNGGPAPEPPGGTPECPDDKNREGCACKKLGEEASCWPGKRVNRGLGACKDGKTKCIAQGELGKVWGKCEGFVLPEKSATKGKDACKCFSAGTWKIDDLRPCFVQGSSGSYATSASCDTGTVPPNTKPAAPWTGDTLTTDCAGHFKLCYSIKQGDVKNPKASDCSLMTVCTEDDYLEADKPQAFPKLPSWVSNDSACVDKMLAGAPVYGEMSVVGKSVLCDEIGDSGKPYVFNRVQYCPMDCGERPNDADCKSCGSGGSGSF